MMTDDIARNVSRIIVPRERKRTAQPAQLTRMLTAIAAGRENQLRDMAIVRLLWATGVRRREMADVQLDDVDLRAGTMLVHGKTRRDRASRHEPG